MNEYVVGIDIGSSKICAAAGKWGGQGELRIVGISSVKCTGLKKAVVVDIDDTSEAIKQCITQLERMVDTKIDNAYISLPGGICELIKNKGIVAVSSDDREIKQKDLERVLEASKLISISSDKEVIGVVPQQYIIDGYENIKDPIGMSGMRLEVDAQIILAQSTIVNNLIKSVNRAGIKVNGIVLEPLAISEVVLRKEAKELGAAIIDVGSETIDIAIYKNGNLCYTSIIPLGGNNITNDIAVCVKIPNEEAEKLKFKYGSVIKEAEDYNEIIKVKSAYGDIVEVELNVLVEIIEARVDEILRFIKDDLVKSGCYDQIEGLTIVGGGISLLKGIVEISENIFNKSVKVGSPEYIGAASPTYCSAVGIVKDVISSTKIDSLSDDYEESSIYGEEDNDIKNKQEKSGIALKIKEFFSDFF
jgi:cell division protein FtsA